MKITFRILYPEDLPPEQEAEATFGIEDRFIGRSEDNSWTLHDDKKFVGRRHAKIEYRRDEGYFYIDHSANGSWIKAAGTAQEELVHNAEWALQHGDILYLGEYEIAVDISEEPFEEPEPRHEEFEHTSPHQSGHRAPAGHGEYEEEETPPSPSRHYTAVPETPRAPKPAPAPPEPHQPPPKPVTTHSADDAAFARLFLEGAGVDPDLGLERHLDEQMVYMLGQAFREAVDGAITLLKVRERFKFTYGLEETLLRKGSLKSPLKKIQDPDTAIEVILKRRKGFMSLPEAIHGAFEDSDIHLLAMGGAIQNSLSNTLDTLNKKISPEAVSRQVEEEGGGLLNKDGKRWKKFIESYKQLELNDLLSEELKNAYMDQVDSIKRRF